MGSFKQYKLKGLGIVCGLIFIALIITFISPYFEKGPVPVKKVSYSGSKNCMECHQEQFAQWKGSHHALAERMITTEDHISAKFNKYIPERVIGEDPIRQFLVKFPGGRYQASELTYDPKKNEWFDVFGNENRRPGEWGHWTGRGMNW
ncbi:MAG: multiheme c-type cytochrome, partial [Bacteriovoracales bacterium]